MNEGGGEFSVTFGSKCESDVIATATSPVNVFGTTVSINGSRRIVFSYEHETETEHLVNCLPHWCSVKERCSAIGSSSKVATSEARIFWKGIISSAPNVIQVHQGVIQCSSLVEPGCKEGCLSMLTKTQGQARGGEREVYLV